MSEKCSRKKVDYNNLISGIETEAAQVSAQPGLPGRQPEEEGKAEQYPEYLQIRKCEIYKTTIIRKCVDA